MSVIVNYTVFDLLKKTHKLMDILYESDWKDVTRCDDEDFMFNKIKKFHVKILRDSEVTEYPMGSSALFDIINRLAKIEMVLLGESSPIPNMVNIRTCINRTEHIITQLSGDRQYTFCLVS